MLSQHSFPQLWAYSMQHASTGTVFCRLVLLLCIPLFLVTLKFRLSLSLTLSTPFTISLNLYVTRYHLSVPVHLGCLVHQPLIFSQLRCCFGLFSSIPLCTHSFLTTRVYITHLWLPPEQLQSPHSTLMRSRLFQLVRSSVLHSLLPHQPVKGPFCPNVLRSLLVKGLFHFFLIARLYQTPVPAVIFFLTHAFPFLLLLSQVALLPHLTSCPVHPR